MLKRATAKLLLWFVNGADVYVLIRLLNSLVNNNMGSQIDKNINKDLILRERLALQRTAMSNDTTLLAFIRTALYFSVAGLSVNTLLKLNYGLWIEIFFFHCQYSS